MAKKLKLLGAACASLGLIIAAADSEAASRSAPITRFDGIDAVAFVCTTSTSFVAIPGLTRTFTVGAGAAEEVVVMLQGAFSLSLAAAFDTAFVRLTIDNVVVGPGDQVPLKGLDDTGSTHGFNWQSAPLAAGSHTARVLWRTDQGSNLCVDARSLIILHK